MSMQIEVFCLGSIQTNAYVLVLGGSQRCVVFDCPEDPQSLIDYLQKNELVPETLFLTHAHYDHMGGVDAFEKKYPGVRLVQHPLESQWLAEPALNLSLLMGTPVTARRADLYVEGNAVVEVLGKTMKVFHTPGHSPGSVVYFFPEEFLAIVGDLLFRGSVGRWDLPGASADDLRKSLELISEELPDRTRIFPGHGGSTTLGREKLTNPYLRDPSLIED